jgi:hypothetical protein
MKVSIPKNESITNRMMLAVDKLNRISCRWLTSDEQQLCDRATAQSSKNADAATLWILHTDYGFTPEQLIDFVKKFRENYMYLENNLQASIEDLPEVQSLKDIGVDLDAIYKGEV